MRSSAPVMSSVKILTGFFLCLQTLNPGALLCSQQYQFQRTIKDASFLLAVRNYFLLLRIFEEGLGKCTHGPFLDEPQNQNGPFDKCFLVVVFKELIFQAEGERKRDRKRRRFLIFQVPNDLTEENR